MDNIDRDRNLLFGIWAVGLKKISADELVHVASDWAANPTQELSERLVDGGFISFEDRRVLNDLVEQAVRSYSGDASTTLEAFGGAERVFQPPDADPKRNAEGDLNHVGVREYPGRYARAHEHARGGMGRILHVQDRHLARDIALKELLPRPSEDSGAPAGSGSSEKVSIPMAARFLQEARITGQLEHPCIVPVYELGHRRDGTLYYTMKLVRGRTLGSIIKETKSLRERLGYLSHFTDLCQAIAYAHSRGVIHRDIKPSNVMIGDFGETVVIDWGLAKGKADSDYHIDEMEQLLHPATGDEDGETRGPA